MAEIIVALTEEGSGEHPPAIELVGVDPAVRRGLASSAAQRLGRELYEVTPERVPSSPLELCDLTRLWERETLLLPVLLYADTAEVSREGSAGIDALFEQVRGHVLMGCREPRPILTAGCASSTPRVPPPRSSRRCGRNCWPTTQRRRRGSPPSSTSARW